MSTGKQRDRMYSDSNAAPWFSGTEDFTGYMRRALEILHERPGVAKVLDLPAGRGQFTDALRRAGLSVTPADINQHRPDYARADMEAALPFASAEFDAAVCLEGIEHIQRPQLLLSELLRVVRPGGLVIISTPNIQNYWSRLTFLFTGTFYQFNPGELRDLPPDACEDRFHISPVTLQWIRTFAAIHGGRIVDVRGDRMKKKWLLPLFGVLHGLGWWWRRGLKRTSLARLWAERNREFFGHLNARPMLFSRTMVVGIERRAAETDAR